MNTFLFALSVVSFAGALFAVSRVIVLNRRLTSALGTSEGDQLEATLGSYFKRVESVDSHLTQLDDAYKRLAATGSLASQKISIVRFNPFGDTGGDQSFVLAVLDAHDSGYVMTSIHGREGTRVYIKPIDESKSKYPLSTEEKQALSQAAKRVPQ